MNVTLYKSSLCPRCHFARKWLKQLKAEQPDLELEFVDILSSPRRTLQDGIRMIPAVKAGGQVLSGLYLDKHAIAAFLDKARQG